MPISNDWSLRTMREKLVKIGAKVVSQIRYAKFQMLEVLMSKSLFHEVLAKIHRLKPVPIG
ncbi:MAG: transposase [Phycisphaerae bacterium]|nr:transposase [Phycisphaerae bacterium]